MRQLFQGRIAKLFQKSFDRIFVTAPSLVIQRFSPPLSFFSTCYRIKISKEREPPWIFYPCWSAINRKTNRKPGRKQPRGLVFSGRGSSRLLWSLVPGADLSQIECKNLQITEPAEPIAFGRSFLHKNTVKPPPICQLYLTQQIVRCYTGINWST